MAVKAVTNADRVIVALQEPGSLSNSELVRITGIRSNRRGAIVWTSGDQWRPRRTNPELAF